MSRQAGAPVANSTIANVNDSQSNAGTLTVAASNVPAGLTISSIGNAGGTITANIAASCSATPGNNTITLQVSDGSLTATTNLSVNVTANTAPDLSYDDPNPIVRGDSTFVDPTAASDNGTINGFTIQSQGTYTGTISVNSTGTVFISNAEPAGSHTITIRATDNCGATTDSSFTLTVGRKPVFVAADQKVKVKGAADPAFTYVASGLVGSDTLAGTLTRTVGETPGLHPITQGTVTDGNNPNLHDHVLPREPDHHRTVRQQ